MLAAGCSTSPSECMRRVCCVVLCFVAMCVCVCVCMYVCMYVCVPGLPHADRCTLGNSWAWLQRMCMTFLSGATTPPLRYPYVHNSTLSSFFHHSQNSTLSSTFHHSVCAQLYCPQLLTTPLPTYSVLNFLPLRHSGTHVYSSALPSTFNHSSPNLLCPQLFTSPPPRFRMCTTLFMCSTFQYSDTHVSIGLQLYCQLFTTPPLMCTTLLDGSTFHVLQRELLNKPMSLCPL
jgi:hypothetical protein